MKDIEKRACDMKVAIKGGYVPESALKKYFLEELEKQRKIDIEKACDFMRNFTLPNGVAPLYDYTGNLRKAMEE